MPGNVLESFITPLRAHFADPIVGDKKLFYSHVASDLSEFDDETLLSAQFNIRRELKDVRRFPALAECLEFCEKAKQTIERRKSVAAQKQAEAQRPNFVRRPKLTVEEEAQRRKYAESQLRTAHAKEAALEGWIVKFFDFCEDHGRMPSPGEATLLKLKSKSLMRELREKSEGNGFGGLISARILKAIKTREKNLREKILDGRE